MDNVPVGEVLVYRASNGQAQVEVRVDRETVRLTQDQMGRLFGRERSVISKHVQNVFSSEELDDKSNVQKLHIPGSDNPVMYYRSV
jgi:hypothetical protein